MINVGIGVAEGLIKVAVGLVVCAALLWFFVPASRRFLPWIAAALVLGVFAVFAWWSRPYDRSAELDIQRFHPPQRVAGMLVSTAIFRKVDRVMEEVTLAEDQDIQGWPAKGGTTATFDDDGTLRSWTASRDVVIFGRKLPAGSAIVGNPRSGGAVSVVLLDGNVETLSPR